MQHVYLHILNTRNMHNSWKFVYDNWEEIMLTAVSWIRNFVNSAWTRRSFFSRTRRSSNTFSNFSTSMSQRNKFCSYLAFSHSVAYSNSMLEINFNFSTLRCALFQNCWKLKISTRGKNIYIHSADTCSFATSFNIRLFSCSLTIFLSSIIPCNFFALSLNFSRSLKTASSPFSRLTIFSISSLNNSNVPRSRISIFNSSMILSMHELLKIWNFIIYRPVLRRKKKWANK